MEENNYGVHGKQTLGNDMATDKWRIYKMKLAGNIEKVITNW